MGDQKHSHRRRIRAILFGVFASLILTGTASLANAATSRARAAGSPTISITGKPGNPTTSTKAAFTFSKTGKSVRVTCQLDSKKAASCTSPKTYTGLAYGTHTFVAKATNSKGSARASYTWRVVRPAPTVTLASPPSGSTTSTSETLNWTSTDAATILCWLDSATPATCAGPSSYSDLALGTHTFTVKVSNESGSETVSATWTVISPTVTTPTDSTPPVDPTPDSTPTTTTTTTTDPEPSSSTVQAPTSPSSYSVPTGAVAVTSSSGLISALSSGTAHDIVLADGVYDNSAPFENISGHRLYAANLGGAVLKAGLLIGSNGSAPGAVVQGITFDVSSTAKVFGGGILHIWGPGGAATKVLDCVFRGNKAIEYGVLDYSPSGLVAQRLQFYDFTSVALWASDNTTVSYGATTPVIDTISDIYVNGVSRSVPGASGGTGEAGVWVGHPVTNGVRRIETRNVSWSGIETVNNSWNTTFSDLDIDMSGSNESAGVGIYLEHYNYRNTFQRFSIRGANTGINAEWADPDWGGVAGSHLSVIEDGTIDANGANKTTTIGVYLDEGTDSTTVTGVTFLNQSRAAIGAYKNVGTNSFSGNDSSGIKAGAVAFSIAHP